MLLGWDIEASSYWAVWFVRTQNIHTTTTHHPYRPKTKCWKIMFGKFKLLLLQPPAPSSTLSLSLCLSSLALVAVAVTLPTRGHPSSGAWCRLWWRWRVHRRRIRSAQGRRRYRAAPVQCPHDACLSTANDAAARQEKESTHVRAFPCSGSTETRRH